MGGPGGNPFDWMARRRLQGQLLSTGGHAEPGEVVAHMTAMQAQDHGSARWSVAARMPGPGVAAAVDRAFADGSVLRTHVLRPTWHYVAASDLSWLIALSGPKVDAGNGRRYRDLGLDARTLDRSNEVIAEAVREDPKTRRELAAVLEAKGIATAGERVTYLLMHAELRAVICSGPMRGKQHTYAWFEERVPPGRGPTGDDALEELARRYFSTRGPATVKDFSWWSGLNAAQASAALHMARSRLASETLDGRTYWFTDEARPWPWRGPRVHLVPCYDEIIISYGQSRNVLQGPRVSFSVPGFLDGYRHVVLADGRLLGHWRVGAGSDVEIRTPDGLGRETERALARAIAEYQRFAETEETSPR